MICLSYGCVKVGASFNAGTGGIRLTGISLKINLSLLIPSKSALVRSPLFVMS